MKRDIFTKINAIFKSYDVAYIVDTCVIAFCTFIEIQLHIFSSPGWDS